MTRNNPPTEPGPFQVGVGKLGATLTGTIPSTPAEARQFLDRCREGLRQTTELRARHIMASVAEANRSPSVLAFELVQRAMQDGAEFVGMWRGRVADAERLVATFEAHADGGSDGA